MVRKGAGGARSPGRNRKNEEVMKKKCLSLPFNHQLSQISEAPLCRCSGGGGRLIKTSAQTTELILV